MQIPYDTPEEYTSFANVLIEAESLLLDLQEYQAEALIEQEFFQETDAFLEAEKEKAREEVGGWAFAAHWFRGLPGCYTVYASMHVERRPMAKTVLARPFTGVAVLRLSLT